MLKAVTFLKHLVQYNTGLHFVFGKGGVYCLIYNIWNEMDVLQTEVLVYFATVVINKITCKIFMFLNKSYLNTVCLYRFL